MLLHCMLHAFEFVGGVTRTVLTDNMKTVVVDRVDGQPLVNGINERLIAEAIEWASSHGVVDVSLNFAVFRSVLSATDPTTLERGQAWLVKRLDRHFQIESLLTFSAKFQPRWISRYVVYRSVTDIPAVATAALGAEGYLPNALVPRP